MRERRFVCKCLPDQQLPSSGGLLKAYRLDLLLGRNSLVVGHMILENKRWRVREVLTQATNLSSWLHPQPLAAHSYHLRLNWGSTCMSSSCIQTCHSWHKTQNCQRWKNNISLMVTWVTNTGSNFLFEFFSPLTFFKDTYL